VLNVLNDVKAGGQILIQAIQSGMPASELNELKVGFNKVLTHVERLITKANQKAAAKSGKAAATRKTAPAAPAKDEKSDEPELGDLRGL
jgi:hypothetical protein